MALRLTLAVPMFAVLGCLAAPREVETTIELGPQKVEIDVRLRDIRTPGADDLRQLQVYSEFAAWDPEWTAELAWAPVPTRFEYLGTDAGQLDVAMHGTMSRADFDRCARAASDAGVCSAFPLQLGKAGYSVRPEILSLSSLVIDPKAKASWAADAGRISYRVGLSAKDDKFIGSGPSLLRGFELQRSDPAKAADTIVKLKSVEDALRTGAVAAWAEPVDCTEQPWCGLRVEALHRERARLVYRYLTSRPEAGARLSDPPAYYIDYLGTTFDSLVPKDPLPPIDDLRLRVLYDVALDDFRESGSAKASWASVCRADTMKKASLKDFCARLGITKISRGTGVR